MSGLLNKLKEKIKLPMTVLKTAAQSPVIIFSERFIVSQIFRVGNLSVFIYIQEAVNTRLWIYAGTVIEFLYINRFANFISVGVIGTGQVWVRE